MRIGNLLIDSGLISQQELDVALEEQKNQSNTPIGQLLGLLQYLTHDQLELVLQAQRRILFSSMSSRLAIESLKYACSNGVSFSVAAEKMLESYPELADETEDSEKIAEIDISKTETETFAPVQSLRPELLPPPIDSLTLIKLSDREATRRNWQQAIKLLEEVRSILKNSDGSNDATELAVYCRLTAIYLKTDQSTKSRDCLGKLKVLLERGGTISADSLVLLAAAASLSLKQGLAEESWKLYRLAMPRWMDILPTELAAFSICLRDAITCARQLNRCTRENIKIGELLTSSGLVSKTQFQEALMSARNTRRPLGRVLSEAGYLSVQDLRNSVKVQLMCRSALLPAECAAMVIKAASLTQTAASEFFKKLDLDAGQKQTGSNAAELIAKMDALIVLEDTLGLKHPDIAILSNEIAQICLQRDEKIEAESMLVRAHSILATAGKNYEKELSDVCQKLGRLLIEQKKYPEAELLLLQSLEIKNRIFGEKHHEVSRVLFDVGHLYFCQASYDAAIGFLQSAWMTQEENADLSDKRRLLELLVKCFEQSGQNQEGEVYRKQLRAITE